MFRWGFLHSNSHSRQRTQCPGDESKKSDWPLSFEKASHSNPELGRQKFCHHPLVHNFLDFSNSYLTKRISIEAHKLIASFILSEHASSWMTGAIMCAEATKTLHRNAFPERKHMTAIRPKLAQVVNTIETALVNAAKKTGPKDSINFLEAKTAFKAGTLEAKLVEDLFSQGANRQGELSLDKMRALLLDGGAAQVQKAAGIDGNKADLTAKEVESLNPTKTGRATTVPYLLGRLVIKG